MDAQSLDLDLVRKGVQRLAEQGDPRAGRAAELLTLVDDFRRVEYGLAKSAEGREDRFTFGPLYVPNSEDAHGEWASPETLQKAVWEYVRSGNREIRLQHLPMTKAGEWVELATWPYPAEIELIVPSDVAAKSGGGGASEPLRKTVQVPANTPFMGVVWVPEAWELVKSGKLRGLSIGGRKRTVLASFDQ